MDQFTRRIIGFGVQRGPVDGPALCRMFNDAIAGTATPKRLSTDNDPLFESHRWRATLRILEVDEVKTVAYVAVSHPFIERVIGTTRREYLDHTMFWNRIDLERKLTAFHTYYNSERVHQSLAGDTPNHVAGDASNQPANLEDFTWNSTCNGLVQLPRAA